MQMCSSEYAVSNSMHKRTIFFSTYMAYVDRYFVYQLYVFYFYIVFSMCIYTQYCKHDQLFRWAFIYIHQYIHCLSFLFHQQYFSLVKQMILIEFFFFLILFTSALNLRISWCGWWYKLSKKKCQLVSENYNKYNNTLNRTHTHTEHTLVFIILWWIKCAYKMYTIFCDCFPKPITMRCVTAAGRSHRIYTKNTKCSTSSVLFPPPAMLFAATAHIFTHHHHHHHHCYNHHHHHHRHQHNQRPPSEYINV